MKLSYIPTLKMVDREISNVEDVIKTNNLPQSVEREKSSRLDELREILPIIRYLRSPSNKRDRDFYARYAKFGEKHGTYESSDTPVLFHECPKHPGEALPILLADRKVFDQPNGDDTSEEKALLICPSDIRMYTLGKMLYDS